MARSPSGSCVAGPESPRWLAMKDFSTDRAVVTAIESTRAHANRGLRCRLWRRRRSSSCLAPTSRSCGGRRTALASDAGRVQLLPDHPLRRLRELGADAADRSGHHDDGDRRTSSGPSILPGRGSALASIKPVADITLVLNRRPSRSTWSIESSAAWATAS